MVRVCVLIYDVTWVGGWVGGRMDPSEDHRMDGACVHARLCVCVCVNLRWWEIDGACNVCECVWPVHMIVWMGGYKCVVSGCVNRQVGWQVGGRMDRSEDGRMDVAYVCVS